MLERVCILVVESVDNAMFLAELAAAMMEAEADTLFVLFSTGTDDGLTSVDSEFEFASTVRLLPPSAMQP